MRYGGIIVGSRYPELASCQSSFHSRVVLGTYLWIGPADAEMKRQERKIKEC